MVSEIEPYFFIMLDANRKIYYTSKELFGKAEK
jgi:hypothetical protein